MFRAGVRDADALAIEFTLLEVPSAEIHENASGLSRSLPSERDSRFI
jgi:hypothetical protein